MASEIIIPKSFERGMSNRFQSVKVENDLAAGVQAGFGLIGYKGKVWSIRYRGDEQQLLRDDGDGPRNSIEVVVLKGAAYISKIWYEQGYVEGSTAAPDCFSPNGVVPDPSSAKKQSNACANCPQNVWGSKITEAGKKGKACSDSKRLAVVPLADIRNETFGGPMLLRVPAASLQDLATYGNKMQNLGYPYFAIATKISFDANEAYPKFNFSAIRPLTDDEADVVLELQPTQEVARVLAEGTEHAAQDTAEDHTTQVANAFEQPPVTAKKPVTPEGKVQAKPATTAATKPVVTKPVTPKAETKPEAKPATNTIKAGGFGASVKAETKAEAVKPKTTAFNAPPMIPDDDEGEVAAASEEEEVVEEVAEEEAATEEEAGEEATEFESDLDSQLAALLGSDD